MRRAINGPVTERIEPTEYIVTRPLDDLDGSKEGKDGRGSYNRDTRPYLIEYLYNHYQVRFVLPSFMPVLFVFRQAKAY